MLKQSLMYPKCKSEKLDAVSEQSGLNRIGLKKPFFKKLFDASNKKFYLVTSRDGNEV